MADTPVEIFAIDFATLAREIACDIFPLGDILKLHQLSEFEWERIQRHPKFIAMLADMQRDWNAAATTKERIKVKAQTGIEMVLDTYVQGILDATIPLAQRTEAGKFLARLGELDGQSGSGLLGGGITINISTSPGMAPLRLDVPPTIDLKRSEISEISDVPESEWEPS